MKCASESFQPGWLERSMEHAETTVMASWSRAEVEHLRLLYPIGWDSAEKLLERLSDRFESWTGRTVEQHIAARPKGGK